LDEITSPPRRDCLAVKIGEDDFPTWATHAILRAISTKPSSASKQISKASIRKAALGENVKAGHQTIRPIDNSAVVQALLKYAKNIIPGELTLQPSFTTDPEANRLIMTNPFAFLLGVIFDQGIPYERAWLAPHELSRRLGHIDPARIVQSPNAVKAAVGRAPKLHRFVNTLPEWVVNAARLVVEKYSGNASAIWSDNPTARELQHRFQTFTGIGQKKAAMAVEILERDLQIPIRSMEGSDIAFDIHVRRVFLRSGLAERDDMEHMVDVARQLYPERPGALDDPAWRIGMQWCRPRTPDCKSCPITTECPKLIYRADNVRGN
jgi:uncharacterized HhH-GPD family protein